MLVALRTLVFAAMWLLPLAADAQSGDSTLLAGLLAEVKALRIEVTELRLERHVERIAAMERELAEARSLRTRLDADILSQEEDLKQWRATQQTSEFNDSERAEIGASISEAGSSVSQRLQSEKLTAMQRERAASEQLDREKWQLQKLAGSLSLLRRQP